MNHLLDTSTTPRDQLIYLVEQSPYVDEATWKNYYTIQVRFKDGSEVDLYIA